jgi:hypothetical protein
MEINEIHSSAAQSNPAKTSSPVQSQQWAKELERAGAANSATAQRSTPGETLTIAEHAYFEQLFPTAAQEIRVHNMYQRDGSKTLSQVGSVVDRKG